MESLGKARQLLILLLLLPAVAQATLTVTDKGVGGNTTASQSPTNMSPTSTILAGSAGVLFIAADNAVSATRNMPLDVTDSAGNNWHLFVNRAPAGANAAAEIGIYVCPKLTTNLTSGGNVPITWVSTAPTAKVFTFSEVAPSAGNVALPANPTGATNTAGGAAQTSQTVTCPGYLSIGNAIIAGTGCENGTNSLVGDSDATNGTWSTAQTTAVGTTTSGISIITQAKVQTTAVSQQTYDTTMASNDVATGAIIFKEVADAVRTMQTTPQGGQLTLQINLSRPIAAGSIGVLCAASSNPNSPSKVWPNSITDSQGNTWTQRLAANGGSTANTTSEVSIYTAAITTALTANDFLTISGWDGGTTLTEKLECIYEFVPSGGQTYSYISSNASSGSSGTPTITTASLNSGDIVIGLGSAEGPETWVGDADTSNGSWSTAQGGSTGPTATNDTSMTSQYKITTGAGAQTYNPTLTAADNTIGYAVIRQASAQSATNGFFQY